MTVVYSSGVFEIYDGEATVADLTSAKGSAPADTDVTYIYTDTSEGILGITSGETMRGSIYVGKKPDATESAGTLKIYGGGTYQMASSVTFQLIADYGQLITSATTSSSKAKIDAAQCNNTIYLTGGLDCDYLQITNVKSGGVVDLSDATGVLSRVEISGYNDASYTLHGVPGEGFFSRGVRIGRATSGIYPATGYPTIDLVSDAVIVEVMGERSGGLTSVAVPGRKASRVRWGSQAALSLTIKIRATATMYDEIFQSLDYLMAEEIPFLLVVRSHGSTFLYPVDVLIRGAISGISQQYPPGEDYRDMVLHVVEKT